MTVRLIAVVFLLSANTVARADLGRLFFTPAQRATLDQARKQNIRVDIDSGKTQAALPLPQDVSVNGVVRRSDGNTTVWLNNRAVTGRSESGINVSPNKNDSSVRLRIPESGRSMDLKVGQTVEIVSGTIQESYSRRTNAKPEAKAATADKAAPASQAQPAKPEEAAQKQELTQ